MNTVSMAARTVQPAQSGTASGRWRVLTGTIAYTDPGQGFAIIGRGVQDTYVARPGDHLPDGSWLREIHPNHVVLEYAGSLETVGLYEPDQPTGAVYVQPAPPPQPKRRQDVPPQQSTASETTPLQAARPTRAPPGEPESSDTTPNEIQMNKMPTVDVPPARVQPDTPTPAAQDPADELSDDRRQRAENRRK